MDAMDSMLPSPRTQRAQAGLERSAALAARYGLILSDRDRAMLADHQRETLRSTGRVEFGDGPYERLVQAFCDSPYLPAAEFAATLGALCTLFYHFKGEAEGRWSDDELIAHMKSLYDGPCHGALELVGDRLDQMLHTPGPAGGEAAEDRDGEEVPFEDE